MKYIVLLRGINISGKNKISMNELKAGLEKIGFENVSTYLNSGNAIFQSEIDNKEVIKENIQRMIKERFNLEIPVYVTTAPELEDILKHTPEWWGTNNKEIYDLFYANKDKIEENKEFKELLYLQKLFEMGRIKEKDLSKEERIGLEKLYKQQIYDLKKSINSYKNKIISIRTKLVQSN